MNHSQHAQQSGEYRVLDLFSPSDSTDGSAAAADPADRTEVKPTNPEPDSFVFVNPLFAPPSVPRSDPQG
ncbi:MAG: hypothetical protein Q8J74_04690 [Candidatus Didemnitutus sp.]|nr:hypothetical protein [Candidatus Didemnitutus sp.]